MPKIVEPQPVYALVGTESFLQQHALEGILRQCGDDTQRSDVDGTAAEPGDVFDELRSLAMFGGRRLVVVRDADAFVSAHRQLVESYLASPAVGNVLVLRMASLPKNQKVYKLAQKVGEIISCEPPKQAAVSKWLLSRAKKQHGLELDPAAAELLADAIGSDLGSLDNELAKLALASVDGRAGPEMVSGGVAFRREQQMWIMTDAMTRGDAAEAVKIWRQLLATDASAEFRAVTWLSMWLEKADKALVLRQKGSRPFDIAKQLKIWPAANVEPLIRTAEHLGRPWLRTATDRLAELDYRIKTGLTDAKRGCEAFVATSAP